MSILVKDMKMPTRCWDCPFYEAGHDESYCDITLKDVARWTPTPRPDDCPLIEVGSIKHGRWNTVVHSNNHTTYYCSECGSFFNKGCADLGDYNYCPNCGARMDGGENE